MMTLYDFIAMHSSGVGFALLIALAGVAVYVALGGRK